MPGADPARAYLDDLRAAFDRAESTRGATSIDITAGGVPIRVSVVGDVLAHHIHTAIGASRCAAEPQLTIRVFDCRASGVRVPPPPWPLNAYLARDEIAGSGADGVDAAFDVLRRVISLYDHRTSEGIWFAEDQHHLAPWDPAAPLRNVLHWALIDHGLQLAHGAAVGRAGDGVLLTARGGSGKSTTAIALARAGWDYVADDYCLLSTTGPPRAHRVYRVAKADPSTLARFDGLASAVVTPARAPSGKAIIDVGAAFGDRVVDTLALRAVVIPRIDPAARRPYLVHRDAADAGRALVPSTLLQLPGCNRATAQNLSRAIDGLAHFELVLPVELDEVPDLLAGLLDDAALDPAEATR